MDNGASLYVSEYSSINGTVTCHPMSNIYVNGIPFSAPNFTVTYINSSYAKIEAVVSIFNTGNIVYQWNTGEIISSIFVNQPGNYSVQVQNNGCRATSRIVFSFNSITTGLVTTSSGQIAQESSPTPNSIYISIGVISAVAVVAVTATVIAILFFKFKRNSLKQISTPYSESQIMSNSSPHSTTTIKGITVLESIGEGNFGKVYRGMMSSTEVALKEVSKDANASIYKEADILA